MFFNQVSFYPYLILGVFLFKNIKNNNIAIYFLIIYSSIFYLINDFNFYLVLFISIFFNYFFIYLIKIHKKKIFFLLPLLINIFLILYFKYFTLIENNISSIYHVQNIYIPLGLSFFTFQQISFLIDFNDKKITEIKFNEYFLYIIFFPQLVAGPIVKFNQVALYLKNLVTSKSYYHASFSFIIIGLFKKIVIADTIGQYSDILFNSLDHSILSFFEAWSAALLFSFQIYFDFSAYSDMAIGIALLFGVKLPENFYSPYKSRNIIEFWRRWHISLSHFIKDYLYIKLGGSKKGSLSQYFNIIFSMAICGIWHGTGANFLIWGVYHGILISINHTLNQLKINFNYFISWASTFILVVIGFAIFRCNSFENLVSLLKSMFLINGISLPMSLNEKLIELDLFSYNGLFPNNLIDLKNTIFFIIFIFFIIIFCPNSQGIIGKNFYSKYGNYKEDINIKFFKTENYFFDVFLGFLLLIISIFYSSEIRNFIYFVF